MIRRWAAPRYLSEPRAAVGPARLRAFSARVRRQQPYLCAICGGVRELQTAHLIAVAENRALALRTRNAAILCRTCHLAFDAFVGVIPPGSRLYVDPQPRYQRYAAAFDALEARRALLEIAYATPR